MRLAAITALVVLTAPALAQTPLTEFNGHWSGSGTDRDFPSESAQPTRCRTIVKADAARIVSETRCRGEAGLDKTLRLSVAVDGSGFEGKGEQVSTRRGSGNPPRIRAGRVSGTRSGDRATFTVHMPGLMPNATVTLDLTSPATYVMQITALGMVLTDVTFRRGP
ncbi:MAG: hypothetical protein JO245_00190 [Pseudolabrys sp.]|nr:hypothetical protein [Pseudolabrys sp.]